MGQRPSNLMGRCPQCGKPALIAPANPWRPFCCERCKLIDLGDWMSGRFVIPAEPEEGSDDELPGTPSRQ